ncbi:MAG: energy-coupling factor transporter ATPase [Bacilli bacterium]|nr:energy-coupling factor transporter ATPase [Bacilli bacterium]
MKIEFRNVTFYYKKSEVVLDNLSFTIEDGTMTAIIGHNGSGKSTIAKLIIGLLEPVSGEIYLNDELLTIDNLDEMRAKMGIIFQNPDNQFVGSTVKDDIAFGLENRLIEREEMIRRIEKYSRLVNMEEYLEKNPENLSGGQKQRVAIAGVLAMESDLIIFDESTSMLDPKGTKEINKTIKSLKNMNNGKTIISITHELEEALYADRILVLNGGKIVLDGSPSDVLPKKDILEASGLKVIDGLSLIEDLKKIDFESKDVILEAIWESIFTM